MLILFSSICVLGASLLLVFQHPVYTVLSLVIVACGISGMLLKLGAEFLGFLFAVIYIGAVVVLFLFCVFMISVRLNKREDAPVSEGFSFFALVIVFHFLSYFTFNFDLVGFIDWSESVFSVSNLVTFNTSLFTGYHSLSVVAAGMLLLVSMVGAIFLTIQDYTSSHTVHPFLTLSRTSSIFNFIASEPEQKPL